MFDYDSTAADVLVALQDVGALVTLTWAAAPLNDLSPPSSDPQQQIAVTAYGAIFPYGYKQIGTQPDSLIRAGDENLLLAVTDENGAPVPEPQPGAVVTMGGARYTLKHCNTLAPAGMAVLFDIAVRR